MLGPFEPGPNKKLVYKPHLTEIPSLEDLWLILKTTDYTKMLKKFSMFSLSQQPRMYASKELSRIDAVRTFLNDSNYKYVDHFDLIVEYTLQRFGSTEFLSGVLKTINLEYISPLSTSFGKMVPKDQIAEEEIVSNRVESWLLTERKLNYGGDDFDAAFSLEVEKWIANLDWLKIRPYISFKDFVMDPGLWGTAGAIDIKSPMVRFAQKYNVRIVKNKWSFAVTTDLDKLYFDIMNFVRNREYKCMHYAFIKPESDNCRVIVLGDFFTYIVEAYFWYFLDPLMEDCPFYNSMSDSHKSRHWSTTLTYDAMNWFSLSIDFDAWDESVRLNSMSSIAKNLQTNIPYEIEDELRDFFFMNFYHMYVINGRKFKGEGSKLLRKPVKIVNGQPSGRRGTYIFNSIINEILYNMQLSLRKGKYIVSDYSTYPVYHIITGDDSEYRYRTKVDCEAHIEILNSMGLTVSTRKTRIDQGCGEFLKIYHKNRNLCGHPLRMIRSLLWSTEDEQHQFGDEKRLARLDIWAKTISRANLYNFQNIFEETDFEELVCEDLFMAFSRRFSRRDLKNYLRTPSIYGGGGLSLKQATQYQVMWYYTQETPEFYTVMNALKHDKLLKNRKYMNKVTNIAKLITGDLYIRKNIDMYNWQRPPVVFDCQINDDIFGQAKKMFPTRTPPTPGGDITLFEYMLTDTNIKRTLDEYNNSEYVVDGLGMKYTPTNLVDYGMCAFLSNKETRSSNKTLTAYLDGSANRPELSRLSSVVLGEVLSLMWWNVVAPTIAYLILTRSNSWSLTESFFRSD